MFNLIATTSLAKGLYHKLILSIASKLFFHQIVLKSAVIKVINYPLASSTSLLG